MSEAQLRVTERLPVGTVTFLFTDVEGSTRLWEQNPAAAPRVLARHDALVEQAVEGHAGVLVRPRGEGDSRFAVFPRATDAVAAARDLQLALAAEPWPTPAPLRVRMALHTGEADVRAGDYYGSEVNRCARLRALAYGGQVLLSQATYALVRDALPVGVEIRDLGEHRLKDLQRPEHIFQLVIANLPSDFPAVKSLDALPNNLPPQLTSFVGREPEMKAVKALLARARLLTLTGPGGTGKTRLALQVAADLVDQFPNGVWFVDLSSVTDPALVVQTINRTLGVRDIGDQPAVEALQDYLRDKELALILDNFEQVIEASPLVKDLLVNAPGVKFLVTSRTALRVAGEQEYEVPQFTLPDPAHLPPLEQLSQYEAVRLFIERARLYKPDWQITNDNAPAVAELCYRLDGLPLAIELAAARVRLLPPARMLTQLSARLNFLTSPARDLPARQQTLRGAIDWSYNLLSPEEQALFTRLSVFAGGATLEASEAVCNPDGRLDLLSGLESLVDKSLIRQREVHSEPRFSMLETIREYAALRLDENAESRTAARRAHATYFAELTQNQWEPLTGEEREAALRTLVSDIENIRAAWRYWVAERDLEQLGKFTDTLWLLNDARGWYQASADLTSDLLKVLSSTVSTPERARQEITLQTSLARALMAIKGYTPEVEQAYARALELCQHEGEIPQLFPVLRGLSSFYLYRGEFEKGAQIGAQILHLAESLDDANMQLEGHLVLGENLVSLAHLREGLAHLETAMAGYDPHRKRTVRLRLGTNPGVAALTASALALWLLGYPDRARESGSKAVALARQLDHPFSQCYAFFHSGFLHLWLDQPEISGARARDVLELAAEHEFQVWTAVGGCLKGIALARTGSPQEGLVLIQHGVTTYLGLKTPPVFLPLLSRLAAEAYGLAQQPQEGLKLLEEIVQPVAHGTGQMFASDFLQLAGELQLAVSPARRVEAESLFLRAYEAAREVGAPMFELRAAVRLTRLWQEDGKPGEGRRLLGDTLAKFPEGSGGSLLKQARILLDSLNDQ